MVTFIFLTPYTVLNILNPTEAWALAFLVALSAFPLAAFAKGSSVSSFSSDSG